MLELNKTEEIKKEISKIIHIIEGNRNRFEEIVFNSLSTMQNENNTTLDPRKFHKLIKEELAIFLSFLKNVDQEGVSIAIKRGKIAAKEGLGENVIFSFMHTLQSMLNKFLYKEDNSGSEFMNEIVFFYHKTYFNSYLEERYQQIISDQEQLFESMIETVSVQQEEIAKKERQLQEAKMKVLEDKEQAKTDFLVNLSHEIKLPLTIVKNAVACAIDEAGNRKLPSLGKAATEVENLSNLIIDMLDYEKIKHGKILYDNDEIINISHIVREKALSYKPIAEQNKLTLTTDIREGLYSMIETRAMDRILNNLLDNAIKYNREKGEIRVILTEEDNVLLLKVRDTGTGIPADQLPHIFKPYYQSMTTKKNIQGIGAGLPIVKNILDEVKGKINISSIEDKETTVTITLIKKDVTENDTIIENPCISKPINRKNIKLRPERFDENKKTVLVVEDKIEMVKLLEDTLIKDYNFYSAIDGQNGLNKLNTIPRPHVIISDIMMDVMDGYEFLRCLKEMEKYKTIPLIFLTAKASIVNQLEGLAMGAVEYIPKPFETSVLKAKIDSLLNSQDDLIDYVRDDFETKLISIIRTPKGKRAFFERKMEQYNLSPREKEVLQYVLDGYSNPEIGDTLSISIDTVKKHIINIKIKCDVQRKVHLINLFKE